MAARVHVIGAGIAGLAAAVRLAGAGHPVRLYEAAGHAGGRCRSYHDPVLDRLIDNGNHLVLSGNRAINAYLATIGAADRLGGPARAAYPFIDIGSGERWTVRPNGGWLPWWILRPDRRVAGSRPGDYLAALRLAWAKPETTVAACLAGDPRLFQRFWEPLAVGVLNTPAEAAAAALLWPVLKETFGRGEAFCRPRIAREGLGPCFIDPALAWLAGRGAEIRFGARVKALACDAGGVVRLDLAAAGGVAVAAGEAVILAVPAPVAATLLPTLTTPKAHAAIVNAHFRLAVAPTAPPLLGLVGGLGQWLFVRGDVASVTISAADRLLEHPAEALAAAIWREVALALDCPQQPLPPWRIIREKRATFLQTPTEVARRPGCDTPWRNLYLAGDWTDTGLPATLEGSVRSGHSAAAKAERFLAHT